MKRLLTIFSILLLIFLSSCEQEINTSTEPRAEVKLSVSVEKMKNLEIDDDGDIYEYRYNATPLFTDQWTTGKTGGFVRLGTDNTQPLSIGYLTQGKWLFEVKALNEDEVVIATGSVEQYVDAEKTNIIPVKIITDRTIGTGSVSINVDSDATSDSKMGLLVRYRSTDSTEYIERTTWNTVYSESLSEVNLSGTIEGLASGLYEFHFILTDNGVYLGGESHTVQIVSGSTTTISGTILPSKQMSEGLDITSPGYIEGTLGEDRKIYIEESVLLKWSNTEDATVTPDTYVWMVDGTFKTGTSDSYEFLGESFGEHQISVLALKLIEGVEREIGSATVTVSVQHRMADITFDANGGMFPDGTSVITISQDTYYDPKVPDMPVRAGYIFRGWYDETLQVVDENNVIDTTRFKYQGEKTLLAWWTKEVYTATVVWGDDVTVNGESKPKQTVHQISIDEPMLFLETPEKDGYTFEGFFTEENGRGEQVLMSTRWPWTESKTLYAKWTYNNIVISFYTEVGGSVYKTKNVAKNTPYGSLPAPMKQGYVFKGWINEPNQVNNENYPRITSDTLVTNSSDHSLYATWDQGNIRVTLNPANGGEITYGRVAMGSKYGSVIPSDPTRTGYTFKGWYWEEKDLRIVSESIVATDQDHTLTARWQGTDYIVSFNSNGGSSCNPITVRYGNPYGNLPSSTKVGHTFTGWKYEETTVTADTIADLVAGNHTLDAQWTPNTYLITFNPNGGTCAVSGKNVVYGQTYGELPTPSRTGYIFDGWFTSSSGGTQIFPTTTVTTTVHQTLYAHWTAKQANLIMYRNWTDEDSRTVNVPGRKVTYGSAIGDLLDLIRTGYNFTGWYTAKTGGTKVTGSTVYLIDSTDDYLLYAHWDLKTISITLDPSPGTFTGTNPVTRTWGSLYGNLGTPEVRTGYDFAGWYYENTVISDETGTSAVTVSMESDHTLTARWSAHKRTVTFNANGGVCATPNKEVYYGSPYGDLPTPTKTGYNFSGWYTDDTWSTEIQSGSGVTTDADHTLIARWTAKSIPVTFDWETGMYTKYVDYNTPYGEFPNPELAEGKGIQGWYLTKDGDSYSGPVSPETIMNSTIPVTIYAKVVDVTYHYHISSSDTHEHWDYEEFVSKYLEGYTNTSGYIGTFNNIVSIRKVSTAGAMVLKTGSTNTSWTQSFPQTLSITAIAETVKWQGNFPCENTGSHDGKVCGYHGKGKIWDVCPVCGGKGYYTTTEWDTREVTKEEYICRDVPDKEWGIVGSHTETTYVPTGTTHEECGMEEVCEHVSGSSSGNYCYQDYVCHDVPDYTTETTEVDDYGWIDTTKEVCGWEYVTRTERYSYEKDHDCDEYVVRTCSHCGGDSIIQKQTTTTGSVDVLNNNSVVFNTGNGTQSVSTTTGDVISVRFNAAVAPSDYPTKISTTRAQSYSVSDNGYGNCLMCAINSSGAYLNLDNFISSGTNGTKYHEERLNLGYISNSTLTKYYLFPGYVYRDSYVEGVLLEDQRIQQSTGLVAGSGNISLSDINNVSYSGSATAITWQESGLTSVPDSNLAWTSTIPVRSFEMDNFH